MLAPMGYADKPSPHAGLVKIGENPALPGFPPLPPAPVSHANRGKGLEGEIELCHARYRRAGAYVQRNPTEWKIIGQGKDGCVKAVPGKESPPDYIVIRDGISVLLDAKETVKASWSLSNLHAHQADAFTAWSKQSPAHRAGIVLRLAGDKRRVWWVDWEELQPVYEAWRAGDAKRGEASIGAEWLIHNAASGEGADWWPMLAERAARR